MLFIYLRLPYRRQLRVVDPETAALVDGAIGRIALDFDAKLRKSEVKALFSIAETEGCAFLRAAEALRSLAATLEALGPRLHGYTLIIDRSEREATDALEGLDRLWLGLPEDGAWVTSAALARLGSFLRSSGQGGNIKRIVGFSLADPILPPEWKAPVPDPGLIDAAVSIMEAMRQRKEGAEILLALGPGEAPGALIEAALRRLSPDRTSILRGGPGTILTPLAPFFAFPPPDPEDFGQAAQAARGVAAGLCRHHHGPALLAAYGSHLRTRLGMWDRGEAEGPAWIVFEDLDRFSEEGLSILSALLEKREENRSSRAPLILATAGALPKELPGRLLRSLAVPPFPFKEMAESATKAALAIGRPTMGPILAGAAKGEAFRLGLALRIAWTVHQAEKLVNGVEMETAALMALAIEGLSAEFGGWLRALAISEDLLDDAAYDEFLSAAGYDRGIRPLMASSMASLGLVLDEGRPRLAHAGLQEWIEATKGDFESIDRAFAAELAKLYAKKRISPSLALYRLLVAKDPAEKARTAFLLDALAADMTQGPSILGEKPSTSDSPIEGCIPLFRAWTGSSGRDAALALDDLATSLGGASPSSLDSAMLSFARSVDDFSRGVERSDASSIRNALMRFHDFGAQRAEAKAHRLLGLAALSNGQIQEAADYLSNAEELASSIPEGMESFFSSLAAAGAAFVLGDMRHSGLWIERAETVARSSFRPDWALGSAFAAARLDFELGRYGAAVGTFEGIVKKAGELGNEEARERAMFWAVRAASWSGTSTRSRALLSSRPDDAEASWFLAEIAAWEGDWDQAALLADRACASIPARAWRPIDALSWNSGFDLLEGPCLGLWPSNSYLADQTAAFASYVHAMAESDPARIEELSARSREGRLAAFHPQAHLYDWLAYLACETLESPPFDPATLLSRAWKALQTRTLRIEDAALKTQFLEGNRWNREIVSAARARRLI